MGCVPNEVSTAFLAARCNKLGVGLLKADENLSLLLLWKQWLHCSSRAHRPSDWERRKLALCLFYACCHCASLLSTSCTNVALARGRPQALSDSRSQTVCPTDKTTRSLPTMLVWKFVKSKLQRLPQSTVLPHVPCCSGNSISGSQIDGVRGINCDCLRQANVPDTISIGRLLPLRLTMWDWEQELGERVCERDTREIEKKSDRVIGSALAPKCQEMYCMSRLHADVRDSVM